MNYEQAPCMHSAKPQIESSRFANDLINTKNIEKEISITDDIFASPNLITNYKETENQIVIEGNPDYDFQNLDCLLTGNKPNITIAFVSDRELIDNVTSDNRQINNQTEADEHY